MGTPGQGLHHRDQGLRRRPHRLRQRRLARHLHRQRLHRRRTLRQGTPSARRPLPQQSRRHPSPTSLPKPASPMTAGGFGVSIADLRQRRLARTSTSLTSERNRLYHNNHNGHLHRQSPKKPTSPSATGLPDPHGLDYDGDGRLDLFVAGYLHWDWNNPPAKGGEGGSSNSFCTFRGEANSLRTPRSQGRGRPSLPQQRRRHLHRTSAKKAGVGGQARLLRPRCRLRRHQQRRAKPRPPRRATTRRPTTSTSTRATAPLKM